MSRLTAMDVEHQEFRRRVRGFDPEEVQLYLRVVAEEIERLNLDNGQLQDNCGNLKNELNELRSREKTLQETLVTAHKMAEDLKQKGRHEAELIVKQARLQAEQMVHQSREQLTQLESDVARLAGERQTLESRLRCVIEQHQQLLDLRAKAGQETPDNVRVMRSRVGADIG